MSDTAQNMEGRLFRQAVNLQLANERDFHVVDSFTDQDGTGLRACVYRPETEGEPWLVSFTFEQFEPQESGQYNIEVEFLTKVEGMISFYGSLIHQPVADQQYGEASVLMRSGQGEALFNLFDPV